MSERGVFAVDRGVWDHPIFAPEQFTEREAWMWMCGNAAWKDTKVRVGRTWISVARGQLAYATRFLAQKWRWSDARVRRFLNRLRFDAMVYLLPTREATIITICNYDKYAFGRRTDVSESDAPERHEVTRPRRKEEEPKNSKNEEKNIGAVATATRPNTGKIFDEEFWPSYPKRDGANPRKPAREKFVTAVKSGHDPQAIVGGVRRYAAQLAKSNHIGTKYVAQAVTWINQARWEDYPEVATETTGPPLPPDPSMPSHEEMMRRYGGQNATPDASSIDSNHERDLRREGDGVRPAGRDGQEQTSDHSAGFTGVRSVGSVFQGSSWLPAVGAQGGQIASDRENDGAGPMA